MSFTLTDQHISEYHSQGCTIFRKIVPSSLIADLRRAVEPGREQAYIDGGPSVQRFQPVSTAPVDQKPFRDFAELAVLNDAVHAVLSPRHVAMNVNTCGVLMEPREQSWCIQWHRDWRDNTGVDKKYWRDRKMDIDLFNQMNCPLYSDDCTWVVPGSHLREDTPGEMSAFPHYPPRSPELEGLVDPERELASIAYCRRMPGAMQFILEPGDYALYRNSLWHIGNYVPYRKRATLHDYVDTPAFKHWRENAPQEKKAVYG
jgi:ectoine hydroxylase-related dioxygenase (phytanoyl-CoA dioxygenase family)